MTEVEPYGEPEPKGIRGFKQRSPILWWFFVGAFVGCGIYLILFGATAVTCHNSGASMSGTMSCTGVRIVDVCESLNGGYYVMPEQSGAYLIPTGDAEQNE